MAPPAGDDDAATWTTMQPTNRRGRRARKPPLRAADASPRAGARPEPPRSVASIEAEYRAIRAAFEQTPCCAALRALASRIARAGEAVDKAARRRARAPAGPSVRQAICLGIGTFDPVDAGWEAKRRTFVQLVAFLVLVQELETLLEAPIPCLFQEPLFSASDTAFLTSLGHSVVCHPAACRAVDAHTLLYGVHLYRSLYALALARGRAATDTPPTPASGSSHGDDDDDDALPAVFIGTGWPVWDAVMLSGPDGLAEGQPAGDGSDAALMARLRRIEDEYESEPFPQDEPRGTAFSSTGVYWRRSPLSERNGGDDDGGGGGDGG